MTLDQALAAGLTPKSVRHRLEAGRWEAAGWCVHRLRGTPPTWEQRLFALAASAGTPAAASHRSAAALLGLPGFPKGGCCEVTTPRPRRHRDPTGICHRWRVLPEHHLTVIDGIPTTRVARTLVDLAGVLVELDSRRHHSALLDRQADAERDARLLAAGWRTVVRITWDESPPGRRSSPPACGAS